jgi:predicted nicotinamide N-methyase
MSRPEPRAFIQANLQMQPAPSVPEITLYAAHSGSRLRRLLGRDNEVPPYWAYHWAGGTVLARYIFDRPETAADKRVLDLGTGSGLVAIAAMKCGASHAAAVDVDPIAVIAADLNAAANGVAIDARCADILGDPPPDVDIILAGDLFYDTILASKVLPFLRRCRDADIDILIGDPNRAPLPRGELKLLAEYPVPDFGETRADAARPSGIFTLENRRQS